MLQHPGAAELGLSTWWLPGTQPLSKAMAISDALLHINGDVAEPHRASLQRIHSSGGSVIARVAMAIPTFWTSLSPFSLATHSCSFSSS